MTGDLLFSPPVREFSLTSVMVEKNGEVVLGRMDTGSTIFVKEGMGRMTAGREEHRFVSGSGYFVPSGVSVRVDQVGKDATIFIVTLGRQEKL